MRQATIVTLLVAAMMSVALFFIKYEVNGLESELNALNRSIVADRELIHVLEAEWSHLNEPARLRGLAQRHLGLAPVVMEQIATPAGLDVRLSELPERPQPATLRSVDAKATSP